MAAESGDGAQLSPVVTVKKVIGSNGGHVVLMLLINDKIQTCGYISKLISHDFEEQTGIMQPDFIYVVAKFLQWSLILLSQVHHFGWLVLQSLIHFVHVHVISVRRCIKR